MPVGKILPKKAEMVEATWRYEAGRDADWKGT
jgi:hypothetical protein